MNDLFGLKGKSALVRQGAYVTIVARRLGKLNGVKIDGNYYKKERNNKNEIH